MTPLQKYNTARKITILRQKKAKNLVLLSKKFTFPENFTLLMDRELFWDEALENLAKMGNNHLFVIGIDAYKNGITPLNNCVRDAKRFAQVLTEKYHFQPPQTLYNEDATLENIIENLATYTAKLTEHDNLVICYSGHGYLKDGVGYLVPVDAKKEKVFGLLNNEQIKSYIKNCKAKHIVFIVDSCYSGSFLLKDKDFTELKGFSREVVKYPSRWVLAAGRIEKVADGEYGKHSPFATTLLTFLEKNTDQPFCISELAQYVKTVTSHNANQTPIAGVLKDTNDLGGEFVFVPRNHEQADFEACTTKKDVEHFIKKYPKGKFFDQAQEKLQAFILAEAKELFGRIQQGTWEQKATLVTEYKRKYKQTLDEQLYLQVLEEGKKADDYSVWKKVNQQSENSLELFVMRQNENFFVPNAKVLLAALQVKREQEEAEVQEELTHKKKEEEERKQAEALRQSQLEKARVQTELARKKEEEEEEKRKQAEALRQSQLEKERVQTELARKKKEEEERKQAEALRQSRLEKERVQTELAQKRKEEEEREQAELEKKRKEEERVKREERERKAQAEKQAGETATSYGNQVAEKPNYLRWAGVGGAVMFVLWVGVKLGTDEKPADTNTSPSNTQAVADSIRNARMADSVAKVETEKAERFKPIADTNSPKKADAKKVEPIPAKKEKVPNKAENKGEEEAKKEAIAWERVGDRISSYSLYLQQFPNGKHAAEAKSKRAVLQREVLNLENRAAKLRSAGMNAEANEKEQEAKRLK
ncbi:MAG: caspase domain-containing protein [Bacteroidia bacterium]